MTAFALLGVLATMTVLSVNAPPRRFPQALSAADSSCPATARAHYTAGRAALANEDPIRGRRELEAAVAGCSGISPYHAALGRAIILQARDASVLRKPGLARRARAEWELAVRLDSTDVIARSDLVTWFLTAPGVMGGSERRAMEIAEEIRRYDAVRGAVAAGHVHRHAKRKADALREVRLALELDPGSEPALNLLRRLEETP